MKIPWGEYQKLMPMATKIWLSLYGEPKSHHEYIQGFNIRGKIIRNLYGF